MTTKRDDVTVSLDRDAAIAAALMLKDCRDARVVIGADRIVRVHELLKVGRR